MSGFYDDDGNPVADGADLGERGWRFFPCIPGTKRPAVGRWEQRARANPGLAAGRWPSQRHNVGIACGPSGLVVIDLDPPDGRARLEALGHDVPATFTVSTPGGGEHLYFAAIPGREIRNSAGRIALHIDVRGAGGYVVGPGSVVDGRAYRITDDRPPVPLPGWLADLADPPRPAVCVPRILPVAAAGGYAAAALAGEAENVATAARGTRNDQLNRSAFSLGTLIAAGALTEAEVTAALLRAAADCGLIADDGPRRCMATIASGLRAGMVRPRVTA